LRRRWVSVVMTLLMLLMNVPVASGAPAEADKPAAAVQAQPAGEKPDHKPGEILVHFAPNTTATERVPVHAAMNGEEIGEIKGIDVVVVRVPQGKEEDFLERYRRHPRVLYAELHHRVEPLDTPWTPNDPCYAGCTDTSGNTFSQWGLSKIQSPAAWPVINALTGTTTVAVIDSGVEDTHPDLSGQLLPGYNFVSNTNDPEDYDGHGTHVAGIIGAVTNNGTGVASIGKQAVRIMPLKALAHWIVDSDHSDYAGDVARAVIYAADNGAKVINMSLRVYGYSHAVQKALHYAWSRDVLPVVAAGNFTTDGYVYPAASVWALAVSATDSNDQKASWSSYGRAVTVSAPGEGIYSTVLAGRYGLMSGTSQAAPFVAGLAGVLRTQTPTASNLAIMQRIQQTADNVSSTPNGGRSDLTGYGRISAHNAVHNTVRTASVGGIYGQVLDTAGNPDRFATVTATSSSNRVYTTAPSYDGHFRFDNLPTGSYTVRATTNGGNTRTATVSVIGGADQRILLGSLGTTPGTYGVNWVWHNTPPVMATGGTASVTVRVNNAGSLDWAVSGSDANRVRLGYRWYNSSNIEVAPSGDAYFQAGCPTITEGGGTTNITAGKASTVCDLAVTVQAPASAGTYTLKFDLKEGSSTWWSATTTRGTTVLSVPVRVASGVSQNGLTLSPSSPTILPGAGQQFTATARYTDGTTAPVTTVANWTSSDQSKATVSDTGLAEAKALGSSTITAAFGGYSASTTLTVSNTTRTQTGLTISPTSASINVGSGRQFTATATYSDGTSSDVTSSAAWTSSSNTVATVSTSGYATGQNAGSATITASFGGYSASAGLTVNSTRTQTGLTISPTSASISVGAGQQFTATATYSDGTSSVVTSSATWTTTNTAVATVSSGGFATGSAAGSTTIRASYGGYTASATLNVTCTAGSSFDCPLTLSGSTSGSVSQGQNKYYRFSVTAGQQVTVTLAPSSGDPDLYIHDPNRTQIGSSASGSGNDVVTFTASTSGHFFARVYGYSAANFTISTTAGGGGCTTGSSFDCPITLSGSASGSVSQGQEKFYRFSVTAGQQVTVTLAPSSGDPDLYVFDPNRTQIGSSASGSGNDVVTFTASTSGYYFARVYGFSAANYTISVTGGGGGCSDGSNFDCAILLSSSTSSSVSQGQSKYYKISVSAGSSYTVRLTPSSGDSDLYVYDTNRAQIGSSAAGGTTVDSVTFTATASGYYYIRVYGYQASSYTLSR
jgi:thermitase